MLKMTNPQRAAVALLIGPMLLMATACGSSADSQTSARDGVEAPDNPEDAMALFNECMDEHGFGGTVTAIAAGGAEAGGIPIGEADVQEIDPQANGGSFEDFDKEAFDEANEACGEHLANLDGGFDPTPEQEAAMADAQLAFADCMAEQGIEMPEIASSDGGFATTAQIDPSEVDPQSGELSPDDLDFDFEAFNEAATACNSVFDQLETAQP